MKKIIFILFLIIVSFINLKTTYAFWVNFDDEKWFYSSIADNIDKVEKDLYKIDIVWKEWTMEKINNLTENDCLTQNLSMEEINYVVSEWKIDLLYWKIDEKCKISWWEWITNTSLLNLIWSIEALDAEYKKQTKEKTNQIFNLWSTWIYSDWIEWNAPFDLISDLQNIDSIIFSWKSEIYDWNKDLDLENRLNDLINISNNNNKNTNNNSDDSIVNNNDEFNDLQIFNSNNSSNIYSRYLCSLSNSNSWLSSTSLYFLNSEFNINDDWLNWINDDIISKYEKEQMAIQDPRSNYSKVNDNSQFPCNTFFCIDIDFIMYEHNLLRSWNEDVTIEYLIKRSNDHLKKFTNTSLVWAKMTLNNFELWLKDLNLPDVFHVWIQISKKPVPILKIEKENKIDESIYKTENQLKFYYEVNWLDYKRRNDLSIFKKTSTDKQIALNSSLLTTTSYLEKVPQFNKYLSDKIDKKELMWKIIANETKIWIVSDFELQFKEIESFNWNIKDYIINLDKIISNMLKIPSDTWMN